jgi:hypothetical protein
MRAGTTAALPSVMLFLAALSCACSRYHGRFTDSGASGAATLLDASPQLNSDASTPPGLDAGPARRPKRPLVILRPHSDAPAEQWQLDVFATSGFADENMAWSP